MSMSTSYRILYVTGTERVCDSLEEFNRALEDLGTIYKIYKISTSTLETDITDEVFRDAK